MNQVHFRESFNGTTLFIEAGDVFSECAFYDCRIVIPDNFALFGGDEFECCHFHICRFMTVDYYLNLEGGDGPNIRIQ